MEKEYYKCPLCDYVTHSIVLLKGHFKRYHLCGDRCPICGQYFKGERGVKQHIIRRHPGYRYLVLTTKGASVDWKRRAKMRKEARKIFRVKSRVKRKEIS